MDPDEKADLIKETEWKSKIESRVTSLEADRRRVMYVLGAAALAVLSQMWDQIRGIIFHGN
jgi:uncharacterized protein YqgV (UPF0045/DUF77 family)